jgi:hypothetical protein
MGYLTEEQIIEIKDIVELQNFASVENALSYSFDSEVVEYNEFLKLQMILMNGI